MENSEGNSQKKTPSDFLKNVLGRPVDVKLNNGSEYRGVLACLDGFMNIAMEQTQEFINGQLKAQYGDCFIRGNNVLYIAATNHSIAAGVVMLGSKHSTKHSQTRFNLLLLEDGEYFLEDYSVFRYFEFQCDTHRKQQGRLKVCTRGFLFEPHDLLSPIIRLPFRSMPKLPQAHIFDLVSDAAAVSTFFTVKTSLVIEMKERGVNQPYNVRETDLLAPGLESSNSNFAPSSYMFALVHSRIDDFIQLIQPIWKLAQDATILNKIDEETKLGSLLSSRVTDIFDASLMVDFRERPLLTKGKIVNRIVPLLKYPGCLMLTNQRLYFQPAQVNNIGDPCLNWMYQDIKAVYKRRHMLKQTGLEITVVNGSSFFFSFLCRQDREEIYDKMMSQQHGKWQQQESVQTMLMKWQRAEISNYAYLWYLNHIAGRTCNDLTQYPVFPWIIDDYKSSILDLSNPKTYRDLSKPIGALNEERLDFFKKRYEAMPKGQEAEGCPPPFLYGTHYSTPGYVLYYLVRMAPEYMLCLQNGKFDAPDRLFQSIESTWKSCLTNPADLKELIPCFYDQDTDASIWLSNIHNLDLGTTQNLARVADVELPAWAKNPSEYVRLHRQALESEYVSAHLHEWIDLIFGYKQQGKQAVESDNLFYFLSYEGSVDLEAVTDPVEKCSLEAQIQEFGQTPRQLFVTPHPARQDVGKCPILTEERVPNESKSRNVDTTKDVMYASPLARSDNEVKSFQENEFDSEIDDANSERARRSVFAFRGRSLTVPKQAQKFVGGLTAQIRRRMHADTTKAWNWTFDKKIATERTYWAGSSPHQIHSAEITSIVLAKNASVMYTTSKNTTFKVSATADGTIRRTMSCDAALTCSDISNDERFIFIGSTDQFLYMYSIECGRIISQIKAHDDGISCVCVYHDRIMTAASDSIVKMWQYSNTGITPTPIATFTGCDGAVLSLHVCADGTLGIAGTRTGRTYILDLRNHEILCQVEKRFHSCSGVTGLSSASDSSTFISVSLKNELQQISFEGKQLSAIELHCDGQIRSFGSDGEYVVAGTSNGRISIWKLSHTMVPDAVYEIPNAHAASICSLTVTHNGQMMVSASVDGSIRIWTLKRKISSRSNRFAQLFSPA